MSADRLAHATEAVVERCISLMVGGGHDHEVHELARLRARLHEPLRVAIAGRVKAGKSTLLNALVGERLAPTDAGECTKVVSWYRDGHTYAVTEVGRDGGRRELPFRRDGGTLEIDLQSTPAEIDHLDVMWPSRSLREVTLIDTPGLASADDTNSVRTRDFLAVEDDRPSDADAVIYLMRHMHRLDSEFLETFFDHTLSNASPVNAIAVLSRADEIGAGRMDAVDTARRIASRYASDERVRSLCSTVVAVAGLIAETGLTLTEAEAAWLRQLAALDASELGPLLLSADRFVDPTRTALAPENRADLLARLGLFGVRLCIARIRAGEVSTAVELARVLVEVSGLTELSGLLRDHFLPRARTLQVRSVLSGLRAMAARVGASDPALAATVVAGVEELEAGAHELAELRLVHLLLTGMVSFGDDDAAEVRRVTGTSGTAARLGLPDDASPAEQQAAALAGIEKWRVRGERPTLDPAGREACAVVVRSYEGLYAAAFAPPSVADAGVA
ncbi:MAG TPA: dynamin family protein [Acidimicrobiales bacterium]